MLQPCSSLRRFAQLSLLPVVALCVSAGEIKLERDSAEGVYWAGAKPTWTVRWVADAAQSDEAPPTDAHFKFLRGGATEVLGGLIMWERDQTTALTVKIDRPDSMLLEVRWTDDEGEEQVVRSGAIASPQNIQSAVGAPDDFDAFWAAKLAELAAVSANTRLTSVETEAEGVDYWHLTMDNIRGSHINGQLARPEGDEKLPALLIVQWAGVYGLKPDWVTERAEEGWLTLNILPHDLPIDEPEAFYEAQREGPLKDYWEIGNDDPDTSYFLRMYLSCYRAVEYLKSRPDWNGETLVVMGTSQGGQQTFVTAGLHPDITAALALVPAGADMLAPEQGREPAFPRWYEKTEARSAVAVREASRYYDIANFASRIRAPMLVGVGLQDTVCPPAGVYAAINQVPSYTEVVVLPESGHQNVNDSQAEYYRRSNENWLPALQRGQLPPQKLTNATARRAMLDKLGIDDTRPGADPNNPDSPNAVNYDESKATRFPDLPDPLTTEAGEPVETAEAWWQVRRPEIVAQFESEVYGHIPAGVPEVTWVVVDEYPERKGPFEVITRRLEGRLDNSAYPFVEVAIALTVSVRADATGAVPAVLNFGWPPAIMAMFPRPPGPTWEEEVLARGWASASMVPTSFQADNGAGINQGVIGLTAKGQIRAPDEWGALRAWAWGASRCLDFFETDAAVDGDKVVLEGLSRYGKAVAVAMAFDERFPVAFIGSSGAGGGKLLRRDFGERVENLAGDYANHWMAGNFMKYAGPLDWDDLPVDAHELLALCAPRPIFISVGASEVEGHWLDHRGMFLAGVEAGPVYELLGQKSLGTAEYPDEGVAIDGGEIAWRQHHGGHTTLPNWSAFFDWVSRYIPVEAP
ncbi:acetylxylan esterase [Actomonas aquatica]|uniref:Acetylxylan esterase n=1 Tax=Actomonas aquatica TaxID=2866162 RepID=A0ABZ1C755_9BACT|nr:acetylxylan esterase [Opitutus sp. WL0086]WRQ87553.1 acetylxylan esterase [Opitutus sp. WL0086]